MSEMISPVLRTDRLTLRPLLEDDAAGLHQAFGDPAAMRFWDASPARDVAETATRIARSRSADPQFHMAFAALTEDTGDFVGMVNYHARRPLARHLAVGWILVPRCQHQGLMHEAMQALLAYCFESLDTHRVEAEIEPENAASIRLAERLGFRREGLLRDRMFVAGEARSVLMFALLRPEWTASP
jgi:ribosomal-protein-alanine N-acetyltransferase